MKVLIVSDTHRQNENFMRVMDREEPIDLLIHCGDIEGSEYLISRRAGCPVYMVAGNNDAKREGISDRKVQGIAGTW